MTPAVSTETKASAPPAPRPSLLSRLKWLLLALPPLWILFLVNKYGVDVPFGDQWDGMGDVFQKQYEGHLGISDLFAFHNEHRIFFPRLIMYAAARLTGWNIRFEMFIIWLLACVILVNLIILAKATHPATGRNTLCYILLVTSAFLFSPLEWENWLWGFQIGFLLPTAVFTGLLLAARPGNERVRFVSSIALCLVNTFSMASGAVAWFLAAPLLLLPGGWSSLRKQRHWWALWLATAVLGILLCFHHFVRQDHGSLSLLTLRHPLQAASFCLMLLGLPFTLAFPSNYVVIADCFGALMVSAFVAASAFVWKHRSDAALVGRLMPWLMLCLYAISNALLITVGRFRLGFAQALCSRYTGFEIMLPVGLLFVFAGICGVQSKTPKRALLSRRNCFLLVATAMAFLHGWAGIATRHAWGNTWRTRLAGKSLLLTINLVDEPNLARMCLLGFTGVPLQSRANVIDSLGYFRPPLLKSFADCMPVGNLPYPLYGAIEKAGRVPGNQIALVGWAILPGKNRPADAVLLTYQDKAGKPVPFALALVGSLLRASVAKKFNSAGYLQSGWVKTFDATRLAPGATQIRAWAFDALEGKAYPLNGAWNPGPSGN